MTRRRLLAACARGAAVGVAATVAGSVTEQGIRGVWFGLEIGCVVAAVGAIVASISPYIEWWADALPAQRLGVFGLALLLAGFALQSLQYWAALLNLVSK